MIPPVANVCSIRRPATITISWIVKPRRPGWGGFQSLYRFAGGGKILPADAQYCLCSIEDAIRRAINDGARKLTLWMNGPLNEWDLYTRQFRAAIQNYRLKDEVEVTLVVPGHIEDPELLQEIAQFAAIGVQLCQSELNTDTPVVAQVAFNDRLMTLISRSPEATIPGPNWHLNSQMVIRSHAFEPITLSKAELLSDAAGNRGPVNDIEIHKQLNGPVSQFGQRFWGVLTGAQEDIQTLLKENR